MLKHFDSDLNVESTITIHSVKILSVTHFSIIYISHNSKDLAARRNVYTTLNSEEVCFEKIILGLTTTQIRFQETKNAASIKGKVRSHFYFELRL